LFVLFNHVKIRSHLFQKDEQHFAEGDPRYLAAEVLHERKFSKAADIFALGASMLEMVHNFFQKPQVKLKIIKYFPFILKASDLDLPAQGHLWHELRQTGPDPKLVSHLSADLKGVIQASKSTNYLKISQNRN